MEKNQSVPNSLLIRLYYSNSSKINLRWIIMPLLASFDQLECNVPINHDIFFQTEHARFKAAKKDDCFVSLVPPSCINWEALTVILLKVMGLRTVDIVTSCLNFKNFWVFSGSLLTHSMKVRNTLLTALFMKLIFLYP